jgi:hypothetical protein
MTSAHLQRIKGAVFRSSPGNSEIDSPRAADALFDQGSKD